MAYGIANPFTPTSGTNQPAGLLGGWTPERDAKLKAQNPYMRKGFDAPYSSFGAATNGTNWMNAEKLRLMNLGNAELDRKRNLLSFVAKQNNAQGLNAQQQLAALPQNDRVAYNYVYSPRAPQVDYGNQAPTMPGYPSLTTPAQKDPSQEIKELEARLKFQRGTSYANPTIQRLQELGWDSPAATAAPTRRPAAVRQVADWYPAGRYPGNRFPAPGMSTPTQAALPDYLKQRNYYTPNPVITDNSWLENNYEDGADQWRNYDLR